MHKLGAFSAVLAISLLAAASSALAAVDETSHDATRYTTALNTLEASGYTNFTNFHRAGYAFQAMVLRHGKSEMVTVNPDTRSITVILPSAHL